MQLHLCHLKRKWCATVQPLTQTNPIETDTIMETVEGYIPCRNDAKLLNWQALCCLIIKSVAAVRVLFL